MYVLLVIQSIDVYIYFGFKVFKALYIALQNLTFYYLYNHPSGTPVLLVSPCSQFDH
jgi:hypothetical protein